MAPPQSWASLVLGFIILISSLTVALPIPSLAKDTNCDTLNPETAREILARSPVPDPRMIPSQTDLMATIFAELSMQELGKLNKLHPVGGNNAPTTAIDDSRSTTHTVTGQNNTVHDGKEQAQDEQGKGKGKGKDTTGEDADAANDPEGFADALFEALKKKFREAINGSDEVPLL
ncbi:uncharacterized protein DSM5745_06379 [Aspergillus mulundensis]|uniref:Uncharacterized protein n=1 Tax=Aspergillus mulundensis TaxID=1810919 RepID=A0A3D8RQM3_9EURO|nr:hypothetical protein DSM5745_06379 [Aspergillus mulundensis]RDW76387.1 hypothetical protein DSM5745_06379 [Aspergillus mulundensis]